MINQRKRACKRKTLASLESRFIDPKTGRIDEAYLNEQIEIMLDNERDLYDAMRYSKQKPESLVWMAFLRLAQTIVGDDWRNEYEWIATSDHLKSFLFTHGQGYDSIRSTVRYIQREKNEP